LSTLARYGVVGGLAFLVDYGLTALLVQVLPLLVANTLGFACANAFNFVLAHFWVFKGGRGARELARAYASVLAISVMGLFLNDLVVWIMIKQLELPLLFGKITAAGLVMLWNYFARIATVYRKQH
jgi:putative flippase GtrA